MNDKPTNRHRDLRSLIRDDAYAASFQSLGQYRTALLEYVEPAVQEEPLRHPTTPSFFEYPSFDESANFDPVPDVQGEPVKLKAFSKGDTYPVGDCGNFVSGIDHNITITNPYQWDHQIEVYGSTPEQAEALRDRILGALESPDVQGEPVAWQRKGEPERIITKLSRRSMAEVDSGVEFIPLYAAPQPTQQQPDPFRGGNAALIRSAQSLLSLDDKGAFSPNGIGGHARNIIKAFIARFSAEHHPAPDVAGLVEALDRLVIEITLSDVDMEYIDSHFMPHIRKARAAIAKATGDNP